MNNKRRAGVLMHISSLPGKYGIGVMGKDAVDFINKLEISLKECYETEFWLEMLFRKGKITEETYKDMRNLCGSIRRRLIASITTAKSSNDEQK